MQGSVPPAFTCCAVAVAVAGKMPGICSRSLRPTLKGSCSRYIHVPCVYIPLFEVCALWK